MADLNADYSPTGVSGKERNIMVLTHLGGILFSFIPSLIVWLWKGKDSAYVGQQAREALNFQITVLILQIVSSALVFLLVGFLLMGIVWLANIILSFLAAIAASKGEAYRYPFTLRLIN